MEIYSSVGCKYGTLLIVDGVLFSNGSLYLINYLTQLKQLQYSYYDSHNMKA